ncbi:N-acetyltransferase [Fulvivirga ligni]|uniref:N-acetyltransferase n=1 Tax=Fulvivirga ligni TaxID=2904246 RepID=UPI00351E23D7
MQYKIINEINREGGSIIMIMGEKILAKVEYKESLHDVIIKDISIHPSIAGRGLSDELLCLVTIKARRENKLILPSCHLTRRLLKRNLCYKMGYKNFFYSRS